ncbi:hypothetical protein B0I75DRAFT_131411 [Yarrowia lipolytica]|nr:hypothetical protein B0I74DRAFT_147535 [Yarrowia lipolytica]RDW49687.1 hypothetical protein B0I75DRAFT_131411 [Yarrowia lipolytica]
MLIGVQIRWKSKPGDSFGLTGFTECGNLLEKIPHFSFHNARLMVPHESEKRLGKGFRNAPVFIRYCSDGRVYSNAHVEHLELNIVPRPKPLCRCRNCLSEFKYSNNVSHKSSHERSPLLNEDSGIISFNSPSSELECPVLRNPPTPVKLEGISDYSNITSVTLMSNGRVEIAVKKGIFEARGRWLYLRAGKTNYCQDGRVCAVDRSHREFHVIRNREEWRHF